VVCIGGVGIRCIGVGYVVITVVVVVMGVVVAVGVGVIVVVFVTRHIGGVVDIVYTVVADDGGVPYVSIVYVVASWCWHICVYIYVGCVFFVAVCCYL